MAALIQDLRYGVRVLFKTPAFSVAAVLALSLGIGANTAIFSVVNAVLIRPLPYGESHRLVRINHWEAIKNSDSAVSPPGFVDYRDQSHSFENMSAIYLGNTAMNLSDQGEPQRISGGRVSANFFTTLGVEPLIGRAFVTEEDQPGHNRVLVLSHSFWQRQFGGDRDVIGKEMTLSGQSYNVIGVMPPGFEWKNDDL